VSRGRIVCATDLRPRSDPAIERAGLLADGGDVDLMLLHVVAPSESGRGLDQRLSRAQSQLRARAQPPAWRAARLPGTAIRTGNPARLVVDEVASGPGTDLLVLGPHRRRPLRDALEGTIAEKVLASRVCAVLLVHTAPVGPYRRVLLALDLSPSSANALRAAERLVLDDDASATIVHAEEPPYQSMLSYAGVDEANVAEYRERWRSETRRDIRHLLRRESEDAARFDIHVEAGHTVRGILRAVDRLRPDLLVMGTRGGGRLHRALLGSVADRVLQQVACDTLIVPVGASPGLRAADLSRYADVLS
jgi:universal stress protein E